MPKYEAPYRPDNLALGCSISDLVEMLERPERMTRHRIALTLASLIGFHPKDANDNPLAPEVLVRKVIPAAKKHLKVADKEFRHAIGLYEKIGYFDTKPKKSKKRGS